MCCFWQFILYLEIESCQPIQGMFDYSYQLHGIAMYVLLSPSFGGKKATKLDQLSRKKSLGGNRSRAEWAT